MIHITFRASELKISTTASLSGPIIIVTHDGEGWQEVQRFARSSFTEWQGAGQFELQIPIIFDGKRHQRSQEFSLSKLERMAKRMSTQPRTPFIELDAKGSMPHDKHHDPNIDWVITNLDQGVYELDNSRRFRVRQEATVTVWQYSADRIFSAKTHMPKRNIPKTYRIKKTDTLQKIAAYWYGDQAVWHQIAALNKIRDPLHLRVGRRIKMPKVP